MSKDKYTKSTLLDGEKIIYSARVHRFSFVFGIVLVCIGALMLNPPDISGEERPQEESEQVIGGGDPFGPNIGSPIKVEPEALSYEIFMWGDIGLVTDVRYYGVAPH